MINTNQGFFQTLILPNTNNKITIISQQSKDNNAELCNKIYKSINKINKENYMPSQFPNITKIKLDKSKPSIYFNTSPKRKFKNKTSSMKIKKSSNKSLKRNFK